MLFRSPKHKGNKVVSGVEVNSYNKPVGYFIRQYDLDGWAIGDGTWIKAEDVIFYYTRKRPSQIREISDMAQTIPRIRDVNEFMMAVSVSLLYFIIHKYERHSSILETGYQVPVNENEASKNK